MSTSAQCLIEPSVCLWYSSLRRQQRTWRRTLGKIFRQISWSETPAGMSWNMWAHFLFFPYCIYLCVWLPSHKHTENANIPVSVPPRHYLLCAAHNVQSPAYAVTMVSSDTGQAAVSRGGGEEGRARGFYQGKSPQTVTHSGSGLGLMWFFVSCQRSRPADEDCSQRGSPLPKKVRQISHVLQVSVLMM